MLAIKHADISDDAKKLIASETSNDSSSIKDKSGDFPMIRKNSPLASEFWEKDSWNHALSMTCTGTWARTTPSISRPNAPEMVKLIKRANVKKLCFSHHFSLWATNYSYKIQPWKHASNSRLPEILLRINPNFPEQMMADQEGRRMDALLHRTSPSQTTTRPRQPEPYRPALEFANALHLPILFHTWSMSPYDGPDIMKDIIPKYPNITYILGHCFNSQWQVAGEIAKQYDNVYLELTSVPGTRGALETMVNICGSEKILFGTDMPWFDEHQGIGGLPGTNLRRRCPQHPTPKRRKNPRPLHLSTSTPGTRT